MTYGRRMTSFSQDQTMVRSLPPSLLYFLLLSSAFSTVFGWIIRFYFNFFHLLFHFILIVIISTIYMYKYVVIAATHNTCIIIIIRKMCPIFVLIIFTIISTATMIFAPMITQLLILMRLLI